MFVTRKSINAQHDAWSPSMRQDPWYTIRAIPFFLPAAASLSMHINVYSDMTPISPILLQRC